MDDFPAGPASRGPWRPSLSVVIPVHDGGRDLEHCLRGLRDSKRTDIQIIVVDDGSTDGSGALAESHGATVARHERPLGPAAARNTGAKIASAPYLFFVDADVVVHPQTIGRIMDHLANDPTLAALFGSYDDRPAAPGLVSQYRNLLHHFVHQQGDFQNHIRPAHTFWTGCGVMRRDLFLDLGGFDPQLYRRPAIEDIELGYRLTRAGHRIALARDLLATHRKRWTLRQVVRTDIFQRGVPWMLLMLRSHVDEHDLNVNSSQRLSVLFTGLSMALSAGAVVLPELLALASLSIASIAYLNQDFYRFLRRTKGLGFALAAFPLHGVYFLCCGLSVVIAHGIHIWSRFGATPTAVPSNQRSDAATVVPAAPRGLKARSRRWFSRSSRID